jgi:ABC-type antimicrobial peptide transport system permease subunit
VRSARARSRWGSGNFSRRRPRAQFLVLALRLVAGGVALGVLGAWGASHALQAVLFHVPALHLPALVATAIVIGTIAAAACVLPSHRAACLSPMEAMTDD